MIYFDAERNHLIKFHKRITNNYWDIQWLKKWKKKNQKVYNFDPNLMVCKITTKYLKPINGPILEGGCGLGQNVLFLNNLNYDVIGIDNAKSILTKIKKEMPDLNIRVADVSNIPFPDNYFAGYWSLGVIEHFIDGYHDAIKEMKRVIKPQGYLFITFPYMSPFRKMKSKFHLYKIINSDYYKKNEIRRAFYQYILNKKKVIEDIEKLGFNLVHFESLSGIKGLKDEIFFLKFFLKKFLQLLYDINKPKFIVRVKTLLDNALKKYTANVIFLIFKKTEIFS